MSKVIVTDTSCLILLDKIGQLDLLRLLFGSILIPTKVAEEFGKALPDWFHIVEPTPTPFKKILLASLDVGEANAILLALEYNDCLLVIDEIKGRKYAKQLGLKITGTLGLLLEGKLAGFIPEIHPIIEQIRNTDFRLSEALILKILVESGEV